MPKQKRVEETAQKTEGTFTRLFEGMETKKKEDSRGDNGEIESDEPIFAAEEYEAENTAKNEKPASKGHAGPAVKNTTGIDGFSYSRLLPDSEIEEDWWNSNAKDGILHAKIGTDLYMRLKIFVECPFSSEKSLAEVTRKALIKYLDEAEEKPLEIRDYLQQK